MPKFSWTLLLDLEEVTKWKKEEAKVFFHCKMAERERGGWTRTIIPFSTNKFFFNVTENKFYTFQGSNISRMTFFSLKTIEIPEGNINAVNCTRTWRVEIRYVNFNWREKLWNVRQYAWENHLCQHFSTF